MSKVLKLCKFIVLDECTMIHKKALEAFNRILQDIRENNKPFEGTLILLAGDFHQTFPVIPRSTLVDEINACLKSSYLWRHVKKCTLTTSMRVHLLRDASTEKFSKHLLDIGWWQNRNRFGNRLRVFSNRLLPNNGFHERSSKKNCVHWFQQISQITICFANEQS